MHKMTMHKKIKRFQTVVLAAAMLLAALPGTGFTARAAEPETPEEAAYILETEENAASDAADGIALPEVSLNQNESAFEETAAEDMLDGNSTDHDSMEEPAPEDPSPENPDSEEIAEEEIAEERIAEEGISEEGISEEGVSEEGSPAEGISEEENMDEAAAEAAAGENRTEEDPADPADEIPAEGNSPETPGEDGFPETPEETDPSGIPEETDPSGIPEETDPSEFPEETDPSGIPEETDPPETPEQNAASGNPEEIISEELMEGTAQETETVTEEVEEVRAETDVEHEDNDLLFEEYAETVFEEAVEGAESGTSRGGNKNTGDRLTGQDRVIYDALKAAALEIADGRRDSVFVEIPLSDLGIDAEKQYTAEDLGLDYIYRRVDGAGEWNPLLEQAVNSMLSFDADRIFQTLWADCPYELYWQRGGFSYPAGLPFRQSASGYGDSLTGFVTLSTSAVTFGMRVEKKYRLDENDDLSVDTSKTGAASAAAAFALSIVNDAGNAGLSDFDRLVYYKDRICQEVVYNEEARQNSETYPDRGPWALIYVFDQDPGTNVVCEGYSEAFQYLCSLTDFQSSRIRVYSPTGRMEGGTGAGPHKWNIVHMDDGLNYMADVTNSDAGSVGEDGRLFLKGIAGTVSDGYILSWEEREEEVEEEDGTYIYTYPAGSISFIYDEKTRALFTDEELTLSATDYVPGSVPLEPPAPTVDEIAAFEAVSLFLTDKIGMRVHVDLDENYIAQDDYMTFICAGRTVTQTVSEAETDENGRAVFTLELAARQMTDQVTFFMTAGGSAGTSMQYSVRTYADAVLNGDNGYTQVKKAMLRAMLNYGSYTQLYAGYHTDRLAAEGLFTEGDDPVLDTTEPDLADYAYTCKINSKTDGLRIGKASLLLGSDLALRIYYEPGEGKTDKSYSIILPEELWREPVLGYDAALGMYYVDIEHITPTDIDDMLRLDFFAEDGQAADTPVASVTFSLLSYCKGELESDSSSDELVRLCRAIYYYWCAAEDVDRVSIPH